MHKCTNCGIEFDWQMTIVNGVGYCCLGCSRGGPCTCDYLKLPKHQDRAALVVQNDNTRAKSGRYKTPR